jgi:hypothetical protein
MRIKLLKDLQLNTLNLKVNDIVNIHIKAAKQLIEDGTAERYTINDYIEDHIEQVKNEVENEIKDAHQIQEVTQDAKQDSES